MSGLPKQFGFYRNVYVLAGNHAQAEETALADTRDELHRQFGAESGMGVMVVESAAPIWSVWKVLSRQGFSFFAEDNQAR